MNKPFQGVLFDGGEFEDDGDVAATGWDCCSLPCAETLWDLVLRAQGKGRAERRLWLRGVRGSVRADGCYRVALAYKGTKVDSADLDRWGYPNTGRRVLPVPYANR